MLMNLVTPRRRRPSALTQRTAIGLVCALVLMACSGGSDTEPLPLPTSEVTPVARATAGEHVALGDSFSSGEGSGTYSDRCHRSNFAYTDQVEREFSFVGETHNATCSGARTRNVLEEGQHGEPPQIDAVTETTSLVTIGIGGNDANWTDVVFNCWREDTEGCRSDDADVRDRMEGAADDTLAVYRAAKERAAHDARIIGLGYPRLFPREPSDPQYEIGGCIPFLGCLEAKLSTGEQTYLNDLVGDFNDLLEQRAEEAGIEFVPLTDAFDGHEIGTDTSFFNGFRLGWEGCGFPTSWDDILDCVKALVSAETFHPTAAGQQRIGGKLVEQINHPESPATEEAGG